MSSTNSGQNSGLEFRLLLAGDEGVGKTSLIVRFIKNTFDEKSNFSTPEGSYLTTQLNLFGAPIKLYIQDMGKEAWEIVVPYYTMHNDGILLVFDSSSKGKVKPYLDYYLKAIRQYNQKIPVIVVANKSDLPIKVNIDKIAQYVSSLGSNMIQTSAKTGDNVSYVFKLLTSEIVKIKAAEKKRAERIRAL